MKIALMLSGFMLLTACSEAYEHSVPPPLPTWRPMVSEDGIYDNVTSINKTSKGPRTRLVNPNGAP